MITEWRCYLLGKDFNTNAFYWRQITFWKDKEAKRPTRGDQKFSLATRFAKFEKIATKAKQGILVPTQRGFEPKTPVKIYGRFADYELILKRKNAQLFELAQPPLSRQPIQPFGRLQVQPRTQNQDLQSSTLHHEITPIIQQIANTSRSRTVDCGDLEHHWS